MMKRDATVVAAGLLAMGISWFVGCTASNETRAVARGSAAFTPFDAPWQKDIVRTVAPRYSYADRAHWRQGTGLFHVMVDFNTGSVVQVTVKKSSGYRTLDDAAITALRQWRFKAGTWRAVDIPVDFKMARSERDYIEKVREFQQQQRTL